MSSGAFDNAFEEAFNLLCGDKIGQGMSRTVFECKLRPDCIVKVEPDLGHFQNIAEWLIWQEVIGTPASRWFAECKWLGDNGKILIQERTRPPAPKEFEAKVPVWFTDLKRTNWGMAQTNKEGKQFLVCHDYGTSLALTHGTITQRMKKADWID